MTHAVGADNSRIPAADAGSVSPRRRRLWSPVRDARDNRRARYAELIAVAQTEMDRLHDQIRGSGYAVLLTDATGVVLYEKPDASAPERRARAHGTGRSRARCGAGSHRAPRCGLHARNRDARQPLAHDGAHQPVRAAHRKMLVFTPSPAPCGAALPYPCRACRPAA